MRELTEYKELDAVTFDNSRLPIKNCVCLDENGERLEGEPRNTIIGTLYISGRLHFQTESRGAWLRAAEVITRSPRAVPEGVAPLPEGKPFEEYSYKIETRDVVEFAEKKGLILHDGTAGIQDDRNKVDSIISNACKKVAGLMERYSEFNQSIDWTKFEEWPENVF